MPNPSGIVETVTEITDHQSVTQDHIQKLITDLGLDNKTVEYNVAMNGMVKPSTGEMMMSSEAQERERNLTLDALIGDNPYSSHLAIYSPTEEDLVRFATLPREETDEVGIESTASMWLHDAAEVSRSDNTLLVSPEILTLTETDSPQKHFHTNGFDEQDAQELINRVNQS